MRIITTTLTLTIAVLAASETCAQDFTTPAAQAAQEAYEAELKAAREKYAEALDAAAQEAVEAGELEEVVRIKEAKEGLDGSASNEGELKRVLWKHKDGYFEQLNDGFWIERVGNGDANIFAQSTTHDGYIEISRVNGARVLVRLYDKHAELLTPKSRGFKRLPYKGEWTSND